MTIQEFGNEMRNGSRFWDRLYAMKQPIYGTSAITTYWSNREMRNIPASKALQLMRAQIKALGVTYPGGFECIQYRKAN